MEWTALGWRDGILLVVVLAAIYLVVMLLRLTQIGRGKTPRPAPEPAVGLAPDLVSPLRKRAEDSVLAVGVAPEPPPAIPAVPPAPTFEWDEVKSLFGESTGGAPVAGQSPPQTPPRRTSGFGEHLAEHLARADVEMEVQRMRSEMERMRSEVEQLRAARNVSPQYAEAMELAQRGLSAPQIADRLGISLAEAELVEALSRSDGKFDEGDEHGADRFATGFNEFDRHRAG